MAEIARSHASTRTSPPSDNDGRLWRSSRHGKPVPEDRASARRQQPNLGNLPTEPRFSSAGETPGARFARMRSTAAIAHLVPATDHNRAGTVGSLQRGNALAGRRAPAALDPGRLPVSEESGRAGTVTGIGVYVRSLSCRNRRPRAGSGGGPAKRYVRSSTTSTTSSRRSSCQALSADPQPARRRRGRSRPHELVPVPAYGRPSSGPLGSQVSSARELPGPPTSLTDTRAADFPAPVAPLTFLPRCSRLMSFLSYILGASTWRG